MVCSRTAARSGLFYHFSLWLASLTPMANDDDISKSALPELTSSQTRLSDLGFNHGPVDISTLSSSSRPCKEHSSADMTGSCYRLRPLLFELGERKAPVR